MQIPTKLKVGSNVYAVSLVRHAPKKATMAEVNYKNKTIVIATNSNQTDRAFKAEEIDDSFWHELTHAILHEMGRKRLCNNEAFVTEFANLLTKAINSAKF